MSRAALGKPGPSGRDTVAAASTALRGIEHPKSLALIVEERLRDAIIGAEIPFGQALPEDETGLALGVSRTPLREAFTRLEAQGLVTIVPKKGAFVFAPSHADVRQLAAFRLMLETNALEQCLLGAAAGTLHDLAEAQAAMAAAHRRKDGAAYARADTAFHEVFFTRCGNSYLVGAFRTVSGRIAALRAHLSVDRSYERETSFAEHKTIIDAFEKADVPRLRKVLSDHILRAEKAYASAVSDRIESQ